MTRTATATVPAAEHQRAAGGIPLAYHAAAVLWVAGMLLAARVIPVEYEALLQEDRFIEWWTVGLFALAAALRLRAAVGVRRGFDLLVGLFCLFVAGEEFSWGQRLLGFTPPEPFLQHNVQQEFTLHNFADVFGQPKGILMLTLGAYAALSFAARLGAVRTAALRVGATPPQPAAGLWLLAAALLLWWYPVSYTGEWVEALAGSVFLVSAPVRVHMGRAALGSAGFAIAMSLLSGRLHAADPVRLACARAEVAALVADLQEGGAAWTLLERSGIHKRLYTALQQGYIEPGGLARFQAAPCSAASTSRRAHGVDPWGSAYWLETERLGRGERALTIYSMGPNRRRDEAGGRPAGDDIAAFGVLRY